MTAGIFIAIVAVKTYGKIPQFHNFKHSSIFSTATCVYEGIQRSMTLNAKLDKLSASFTTSTFS